LPGGDIVSQAICEIGTCAIEPAISRGRPAKSTQERSAF
jgi:hypothetical protein